MVKENLLSIKQVAVLLNLSQSTIRRMIKNNQIPAHKIGGSWRIDPEELNGWVKDKKTD